MCHYVDDIIGRCLFHRLPVRRQSAAQILNVFTEINDFSQEKKRDFGNIFPSLVRGLVRVNGRLYCVYVSVMFCPPTECVSFGSVLNAWHFCNNHRRKVLKSNFWKGLHVFLWFQTSCFMLCFELVCSSKGSSNHESTLWGIYCLLDLNQSESSRRIYIAKRRGFLWKRLSHSQLYDMQMKVSHRWSCKTCWTIRKWNWLF